MLESFPVMDLDQEEVESALVRILGINVYLHGTRRSGEDRILDVHSFHCEGAMDDATGKWYLTTTWMPRVAEVVAKPMDIGGYRLWRPKGDFEGAVQRRYNDLVLRHEEEVLRLACGRLVAIPEVDRAMRPLFDILVHARNGYTPSRTRPGAVRRRRLVIGEYLRLLTEAGYIRRIGRSYVAVRRLPRLVHKDAPRGQVNTWFLGDLLRSRPDLLDDALRLTALEPYLRLANSYYWLAHVAGRGLRVGKDDLRRQYAHFYGRAPKELDGYLGAMLRAGALVRAGRLISGRKEVLGPLLERDFEDWTKARQQARGRPRKRPRPRRAGPPLPRPRGGMPNLTLMEYLRQTAKWRDDGDVTVRGAIVEMLDSIPEEDGAEGEGTAFFTILIISLPGILIILPNQLILISLFIFVSVYGLVDTLLYVRTFGGGLRKIFTLARPLTAGAVKHILEGRLGPARLVREYGLLSLLLRTVHLRLRDEQGKRLLFFLSGTNLVLFVNEPLVPETAGIDQVLRESGMRG